MPDIAVLHPQIVHFVIALCYVGVIFRVLSLLPLPQRLSFLGPSAAVLIIIGSLASVAAVKSGDQAHGPAERVPGARDAVVEHEDWGKRSRNVLLAVALLEIGALALGTRRAARGVRVASAVVGLGALFALFETGEHGGELVYSYAGGVGIRSGDSTDVRRLLVAGLYHRAMQERAAHRGEAAARLIDELARQMPGDEGVRMMVIESRLRDRNDAAGTLAQLDSIVVGDDQRMATRVGLLRADALEAAGLRDSARVVVQALSTRFPDNTRVRDRLQRMTTQAP